MKLTEEEEEEEVREKYGESLVVASLGAQVKNGAKETGDLTVRLLFDGTRGVPVNAGIRVRDQDRSPAAPDLKRVLRQLASSSAWRQGRTPTCTDQALRLASAGMSLRDW